MISAVINVRNGMPELMNAILSVQSWVTEIIVVDMQSEDGSKQAGLAAGAKVFDFDAVGYVEPARSFAVEQASQDWVLIVDADEMIPEPLSQALIQIARSGVHDVVSIPEENWFFGQPLHHSGWEPDVDRHYRFFRRGMLTFSDEMHSVPAPIPGARLYNLPYSTDLAIKHFSYRSVSDFVERMNRYTSVEAVAMANRKRPTIRRNAIPDGIREVYRRYLRGRGRGSDWRGPVLAALMVMYRFLVVIKAQEIHASRASGSETAVSAEIARILRGYDAETSQGEGDEVP